MSRRCQELEILARDCRILITSLVLSSPKVTPAQDKETGRLLRLMMEMEVGEGV